MAWRHNQSYLMLISLVLFQPNFPNDDNSKPLHCITLFKEENARMSSFKSLSEVLIKSSKGGGLRKYKERNSAILTPLESHVPPILHNDCQTTYIHLTCQDKSHILIIKKPWQNYCFYLLLFLNHEMVTQ